MSRWRNRRKTEREYLGKFLVRTAPRVHSRLAEQATRTGRSLNAVANDLPDV
ncbi:toxin-antitoxin system HicB family antitoxin [Gordonia sp. (in: high G+C Gram-positive bacteria)]|uniref:toxin-antitoxin system HicB family antitoxin n=1 Tax=Gordonia sp. (in: high G+C Gram-positive bacteria) TaxID=84139 RepID=UPI003F981255